MLTQIFFRKYILSAMLALLLAGCSTVSTLQPPTSIATSDGVSAISQAELEEIIIEISQEYGVPAMAAAVVTDQGLQQVAGSPAGCRGWLA